ncbi:uncharacterized protein LOC108108944 [Drosophila eugracilis]|uniref:uncharacterized protein LOC108108944 n=1 Tax=Drosophila eugracilis TaxID=29029 RepID=UPI0007E7C3CA|nr:uncharacterized protein LOC108108944 [Drosophila eugracilis]
MKAFMLICLFGIVALTTCFPTDKDEELIKKCVLQEKVTKEQFISSLKSRVISPDRNVKCAVQCFMSQSDLFKKRVEQFKKMGRSETCSSIEDADKCEQGFKQLMCFMKI